MGSAPAVTLVRKLAALCRIPGSSGLKPCPQSCLIQQVRLHLHVEQHAICLQINSTFVFYSRWYFFCISNIVLLLRLSIQVKKKARKQWCISTCHMGRIISTFICSVFADQVRYSGVSSELNGTWSEPAICSVYMQYSHNGPSFLSMTFSLSKHNLSLSKRVLSEINNKRFLGLTIFCP